jgi:DNA-binding response OmpR family regulator
MNHIAQMCANLILSFEARSGAAAYGKLKFGPFELSSRERVLRRDGVVLRLGDRALDILIYLAERPGEVISKQELMAHVLVVGRHRRGGEPASPRGRDPQGVR